MSLSRLHRQMFEREVLAKGVRVIVRQPAVASPSTNPKEKVLGKPADTTAVGTAVEVLAVWSTDYDRTPGFPGPMGPAVSSIGKPDTVDAMIRLRLADGLERATVATGRTIFDTAKDVLYDGFRWKVVGTARGGLPPEGPYILWVMLNKIGE